MQLHAMKSEHTRLVNEADRILRSAQFSNRKVSSEEGAQIDRLLADARDLEPKIEATEKTNTIRTMNFGTFLGGNGGPRGFQKPVTSPTLSPDYANEFFEYIASDGKKVGATLYETGGNSTGGFAVPVVVDDQIVPLAPSEMAVRRLSTVLPTASDIKFPTKTAFGTAAIKAETSSFGGTQLTLGQFTLSAFMVGSQGDVSWELVQDVPAFQQTTLQDMILAQQMLEESYYVTGTGSGQPQGLIGNVGVGVVEEPDGTTASLVTLNGILDLIGSLNEQYADGASFLMSRATSIIIRKAQQSANTFNPAWTRTNGQDYLFGFPVAYSQSMPTAARGHVPVLFGDFKRGYLIGDRGGSGINVKVLDQPKAAQGLITLLTYRRTDGRVRLAEAIQPYYISAS